MNAHCVIAAEERKAIARPTVAAIQAEVARYYGTSLTEMTSACRVREVARPRQVAMFLCQELTLHSLSRIGMFFGGRDHTTVSHSIRVIENLMLDDLMMSQDVAYLRARLA